MGKPRKGSCPTFSNTAATCWLVVRLKEPSHRPTLPPQGLQSARMARMCLETNHKGRVAHWESDEASALSTSYTASPPAAKMHQAPGVWSFAAAKRSTWPKKGLSNAQHVWVRMTKTFQKMTQQWVDLVTPGGSGVKLPPAMLLHVEGLWPERQGGLSDRPAACDHRTRVRRAHVYRQTMPR